MVVEFLVIVVLELPKGATRSPVCFDPAVLVCRAVELREGRNPSSGTGTMRWSGPWHGKAARMGRGTAECMEKAKETVGDLRLRLLLLIKVEKGRKGG